MCPPPSPRRSTYPPTYLLNYPFTLPLNFCPLSLPSFLRQWRPHVWKSAQTYWKTSLLSKCVWWYWNDAYDKDMNHPSRCPSRTLPAPTSVPRATEWEKWEHRGRRRKKRRAQNLKCRTPRGSQKMYMYLWSLPTYTESETTYAKKRVYSSGLLSRRPPCLGRGQTDR